MSEAGTGHGALARALDARRVAIIGASSNPLKMGYSAAWDLLRHGFAGEVVLVNPRGGEILGRRIETGIEAARGADIAMLMMAADRTPEAIAACGTVGIPVAVVCAGGFGEKGNRELQERLRTAARRARVRVIGPNTVGPHVAPIGLRLSMIPHEVAGDVSVVSQSGGVGLLVGPRLNALGTGIDVHLPLGNKIDIGFAEAVRALGDRPTTRAILLYIEDGDEGEALLDAVADVACRKPVVALVGGRTSAAARATQSHTGSMLGSWARLAGTLEDAGAHVARSLPEACAAALARKPRARARCRGRPRVLVLCDGGGASVALAEAFESAGFELPLPAGRHQEALSALIGRPAGNPCDFAGAVDGDYARFARAAEDAITLGDYDAVVLGAIWGVYGECFGEAWGRSEMEGVRLLGELARRTDVPLVAVTPYAATEKATLALFRAASIPVVEWAEEAAIVVAAGLGRPSRRLPAATAAGNEIGIDASIGPMTDRVLDRLAAGGMAEGIGRVTSQPELARTPGRRWVLRLDGIAHKARAGAIGVGVPSADLDAEYDRLATLARRHDLPPRIRQSPLIPHEHELLVSFWRDARAGNGWSIGAGGARVEADADVAIGRWPAAAADVVRALGRTAAGSRVLAAGDRAAEATVRAVLALLSIFADHLPEAVELEVNPLGVGASGAAVLDVLVSLPAEARA
jgi:acyl-CoA synthetase (NDP forming)